MKRKSLLKKLQPLKLLFIFSLISENSHAAQTSRITPGSYASTLVAFNNSTQIVTGYFSITSADDTRPLVRCEFYFAGQLAGSTAKLKIYQLTLPDAPTSGTLKVENKGKESTINLQLDEEQPGCMNISPKAELAKNKLAIVSPASWIEIRMAPRKRFIFSRLYRLTRKPEHILQKATSWVSWSIRASGRTSSMWGKQSRPLAG